MVYFRRFFQSNLEEYLTKTPAWFFRLCIGWRFFFKDFGQWGVCFPPLCMAFTKHNGRRNPAVVRLKELSIDLPVLYARAGFTLGLGNKNVIPGSVCGDAIGACTNYIATVPPASRQLANEVGRLRTGNSFNVAKGPFGSGWGVGRHAVTNTTCCRRFAAIWYNIRIAKVIPAKGNRIRRTYRAQIEAKPQFPIGSNPAKKAIRNAACWHCSGGISHRNIERTTGCCLPGSISQNHRIGIASVGFVGYRYWDRYRILVG